MRAPMERDGKAMRLVANSLEEQQRRIVRRQRDRIVRGFLYGGRYFKRMTDAERSVACH